MGAVIIIMVEHGYLLAEGIFQTFVKVDFPEPVPPAIPITIGDFLFTFISSISMYIGNCSVGLRIYCADRTKT